MDTSAEKTPTQVYREFRESILKNTEHWKTLVAEKVTIKSPLVCLIGRDKFIDIYNAYYETVTNSVIHKLIEKGPFCYHAGFCY